VTANIDGVATPPPELAVQIAAAAAAWASLEASGRRVVFDDPPDGPLQIQLRDDDDNALEVLSATGLFDLIDQEGGFAPATDGDADGLQNAGERPAGERSGD
jgi:hypothetical protein